MTQLIHLLINRLKLLGKIPICNGISSRAPHFFGICFPLCYRCLGVTAMFLLTGYMSYKKQREYSMVFIILLLIPMIIDGCLQTFYGIESTNTRRFLTGSLFGIGLGLFTTRLLLIVDKRLR